jgi:hypothetical protein
LVDKHAPRSKDVAPKQAPPQVGSPYEKASGRHLSEASVRVQPKGRKTTSSPYDKGHTGPEKTEPSVRVNPKATSGDMERPVMMEVARAEPIVSADRPKHVSVRKALS